MQVLVHEPDVELKAQRQGVTLDEEAHYRADRLKTK